MPERRRRAIATSVQCAVVAAVVMTAGGQRATLQAPADSGPARAVLDRYCVTCHNQRTRTAGLTLDRLDLTHVDAQPAIWEAVVRKVRTRAMPPQGMPRPDDATVASLTSWLTAELDRAAAAPNPGRPL